MAGITAKGDLCGGQDFVGEFPQQTTPPCFDSYSNDSHVPISPPSDSVPFSLEALLEDDTFTALDTHPSSNDSWFLLLKNKIINTDKLIQRYQGKNQKIKDLQTSLTGLKEELKLLHQENEVNQTLIPELREELENSRNLEEEQMMYIEQLRAKLDEQEAKNSNEMLKPLLDFVKKEKEDLIAERNRLRKENRKLNKKLKKYMRMVPLVVATQEGHTSSPPKRESKNQLGHNEPLMMQQMKTELSKELEDIGTSPMEEEDGEGSFNEEDFYYLPEETNNDKVSFEETTEESLKDTSEGHEMEEKLGLGGSEEVREETDKDDDFCDLEDPIPCPMNCQGEGEKRRKRTLSDSSCEDLRQSKRFHSEADKQLQWVESVSMPTLTGSNKRMEEPQQLGMAKPPLPNDSFENNNCEQMIATLRDSYTSATAYPLKALTPLPPSPPGSPLPIFEFFSLPRITPLPLSPPPSFITLTEQFPENIIDCNDDHTSNHTHLSLTVNQPDPVPENSRSDTTPSSEGQGMDEFHQVPKVNSKQRPKLHQAPDQLCDGPPDFHVVKETTPPPNHSFVREQATPTSLLITKHGMLPWDDTLLEKQATSPIPSTLVEEQATPPTPHTLVNEQATPPITNTLVNEQATPPITNILVKEQAAPLIPHILEQTTPLIPHTHVNGLVKEQAMPLIPCTLVEEQATPLPHTHVKEPLTNVLVKEQATPLIPCTLVEEQATPLIPVKEPLANGLVKEQATPLIPCTLVEEQATPLIPVKEPLANVLVKEQATTTSTVTLGKEQVVSTTNREETTPQTTPTPHILIKEQATPQTTVEEQPIPCVSASVLPTEKTTPPSSTVMIQNKATPTAPGLAIDQFSSDDTDDLLGGLVIDADIGDFSASEGAKYLLEPVDYEEGELLDEDTTDVLAVGYSSNPPPQLEECPPSVRDCEKVVKQLLTDGATGQWMKETTPSESCVSSRSSSPLLGSIAMEFPCVTSQTVSQAPPTQPVCQVPPIQHLCQAQQCLSEAMKCPLPLPPWLAEALLQTQDQLGLEGRSKGSQKKTKKKKKKEKFPSPNRLNFQKAADYFCHCVEVMINGKLPLSRCIKMVMNPKNVGTSASVCEGLLKLINFKYFPPFESVMKLCWNRCSGVVGRTLDPMNPNYVPPLSVQEALIVSLVLNVQQLRPDMSSLLHEILYTFKEAILSSEMSFHSRCALCRLYSSFCRVMSDLEQTQFLVCDILLQSMAAGTLPLVVAIVSVWPKAFGRNTSGPPLFLQGSLNAKGLEYQPLSFTLEVVMSFLARLNHDLHKGPISNARIICKWELIPPTVVQSLLTSFLEILKLSPFVRIESPPIGTSPARPRPSKHAYAIVMALRVLAASQGWAWTNDTMIRQHLWPLLQSWNKHPNSVREETIVCVIRLLGFIGQKGLVNDPDSLSVQQLQKVFAVILQKSSSADSKVTIPIQLSAVDALLDICPKTHSNYKMVHSSIATWTTQISKNKETSGYGVEYSKILLAK